MYTKNKVIEILFFSLTIIALYIPILHTATIPTISSLQKSSQTRQPKIIALLQIRNEEEVIEQCLRMLTVYADAIIVLDDASYDNTVEIVKNLAQELPITKIIVNKESAWQNGQESDNRQKLLDAGRAAGGTHFILLDADEIFSAPCAKNNWMRNKIISLKPGQVLRIPTVHPWNDLHVYRNDAQCSPFMRKWHKEYAFADDGMCSYKNNRAGCGSVSLHAGRLPNNLLRNQPIYIQDLNHTIIHFKCVNLENTDIKKSWYMCLELIRRDKEHGKQHHAKHVRQINQQYSGIKYKGIVSDTHNVTCKPIPSPWYAYDFFNGACYAEFNQKRMHEINNWLKKYGPNYFNNLELCIAHPLPTIQE